MKFTVICLSKEKQGCRRTKKEKQGQREEPISETHESVEENRHRRRNWMGVPVNQIHKRRETV
ncbi:MAG: hypothetical protein ACLTJ5_05085 [Clostridium sp.]